jgi:ribosomal protein L34E
VVDAVIRDWYHKLEMHGMADMVKAIFYADDGHLYSTNADALQLATDLIVELFERMGLQTNPAKTKIMICAPTPHTTKICTPSYKRRMLNADREATNLTYSARKRQQIECDICQATLQERSLHRHKQFKRLQPNKQHHHTYQAMATSTKSACRNTNKQDSALSQNAMLSSRIAMVCTATFSTDIFMTPSLYLKKVYYPGVSDAGCFAL